MAKFVVKKKEVNMTQVINTQLDPEVVRKAMRHFKKAFLQGNFSDNNFQMIDIDSVITNNKAP